MEFPATDGTDRPAVGSGIGTVVAQNEPVVRFRRPSAIGSSGGRPPWFGERCSVDCEHPALDGDRFFGEADHPLDPETVTLAVHNDISAPEEDIGPEQAGDQVVAGCEKRGHGVVGHLEAAETLPQPGGGGYRSYDGLTPFENQAPIVVDRECSPGAGELLVVPLGGR